LSGPSPPHPDRPAVDVVIPFAGPPEALERLVARAAELEHTPADTIVVVDNHGGPGPRRPGAAGVTVLAAPERRSSYHARNRGAATGRAPWLLFLDADVQWPAELIDRYFAGGPVGDRVAVLAGGVADAPLPAGRRATAAERYASARAPMAQSVTFDSGSHPPYAQTANCLVRRAAFDEVGGFAGAIRSGGDADLCFRLQAGGWTVEQRDQARVVHRNRRTLRALLAQKARHGAGAAWLRRRYPGTFPPPRWAGLAAWSARSLLASPRRGGDDAAPAFVDVLAVWAFELGRLLPNRAPRGR
jgi:GT2 family glycosyltransferase